MSNRIYEMDSGPLAMYVFKDEDVQVAAAFACTHGGWSICLGISETPATFVDSRDEAVQWLESRFPGCSA